MRVVCKCFYDIRTSVGEFLVKSTHNFWMQGNAPKVSGGELALPANWDTLIAEAETELGASGEHCTI